MEETNKSVWGENTVLSIIAGTAGAIIGLIAYAITAYTNNPASIAVIIAVATSYALFTITNTYMDVYVATAIVAGVAVFLVPIGTVLTIIQPTSFDHAISVIQTVRGELLISLLISIALVSSGVLLYRFNTQ